MYKGPYSVLCQHKSGTYSLVPISQIKISEAGINTTVSEGGDNEEHFMVKRIIEHRKRDGMYDYLVEWKDCRPEFTSWEPVEAFDGLKMIHHYWKKRNKEKKS